MEKGLKVNSIPARILLVDDEETIRRPFQKILKQAGFEVDTAENFFEAQKLWESHSYDAILSDIFLPEKTGIDILNQIKDIQPDISVVLFTGMPSVKTSAYALRLGASDYLTKPIDRNTLISVITRAVETKKLRQEKKCLEKENKIYQANLEYIVEKRTRGHKNQKELLENILESIIHPFYVVNANNFTVIKANSAAMQGHSLTENLTCYFLAHNRDKPCSRKTHLCPLRQAKKTKKAVCMEDIHYNSRGTERTVEVHAYPLFDVNNDVAEVILYEIEITERKRLESIAEAINLMDNIGYVFSGIRHEIGNPINSLKMTLGVLEKNLDTFDKKMTHEFIQRSINEVKRIEYLLQTLRNFSLFEKPLVLNVEMSSFLKKFKPLVSNDLKKMGIETRTVMTTGNIVARSDPRVLQQVFLNLVTNAADACEGRENSEILIKISQEKKIVVIIVQDNGSGMTYEQQQDLFKPFFTTKAKGTGLGLVIVKKMLIAMNSTIDIRSFKNKGTTITLTLPKAVDGS